MVVGMTKKIKGRELKMAAIKKEWFKTKNNDPAVEEEGELKMDDKMKDEED
jgi:hypothetical protein